MKRRSFLNCVSALSILFFATGHGHGYGDTTTRTYMVGVEDTKYLPHFTTENSLYRGFARELLDLFAAHAGVQFDYCPLPVKRLYTDFIGENVDFKYPDNPRWQVAMKYGKKIYYSDVVVHYISGAVVTPQRKGKGIGKLKILGVVRGFTPLPFMDYIKAGKITVYENRNFPELLRQTINGRVDAAYVNLSVARYHLREDLNQPDALVFDRDLPNFESSFFLSTIKHPQLIDQFNAFMKDKAILLKTLKKKHGVGIESETR